MATAGRRSKSAELGVRNAEWGSPAEGALVWQVEEAIAVD
jgi:hypothetical protein